MKTQVEITIPKICAEHATVLRKDGFCQWCRKWYALIDGNYISSMTKSIVEPPTATDIIGSWGGHAWMHNKVPLRKRSVLESVGNPIKPTAVKLEHREGQTVDDIMITIEHTSYQKEDRSIGGLIRDRKTLQDELLKRGIDLTISRDELTKLEKERDALKTELARLSGIENLLRGKPNFEAIKIRDILHDHFNLIPVNAINEIAEYFQQCERTLIAERDELKDRCNQQKVWMDSQRNINAKLHKELEERKIVIEPVLHPVTARNLQNWYWQAFKMDEDEALSEVHTKVMERYEPLLQELNQFKALSKANHAGYEESIKQHVQTIDELSEQLNQHKKWLDAQKEFNSKQYNKIGILQSEIEVRRQTNQALRDEVALLKTELKSFTVTGVKNTIAAYKTENEQLKNKLASINTLSK